MRLIFTVVVALIMVLLGAAFMLQGLGIMTGYGMTGQTIWAIIGLVLVACGAVIGYTVLGPKPAKVSKRQK